MRFPAGSSGRLLYLSRPDLRWPVQVLPGYYKHGDYMARAAYGGYVLTHFPEGTWTILAEGPRGTERHVVEVETGERALLDLSGSGEH